MLSSGFHSHSVDTGSRKKKTALVVTAAGTEELELVAIVDILRRESIDVTIGLSSCNQESSSNNDDSSKQSEFASLYFTGAHNITIKADAPMSDCVAKCPFDLIVVPGGMPGVYNLRDDAILTNMLKKQKEANRLYAAICAAPVIVLDHHGLLDGIKATCYPSMFGAFVSAIPVREKIVIDNNCITSQSIDTAVEFARILARELLRK